MSFSSNTGNRNPVHKILKAKGETVTLYPVREAAAKDYGESLICQRSFLTKAEQVMLEAGYFPNDYLSTLSSRPSATTRLGQGEDYVTRQ